MYSEEEVISAIENLRNAYYTEVYEVDGLGVPTPDQMHIIKKADEALEAIKTVMVS